MKIKANYQQLSNTEQEFISFSKSYPTIAQMLPGVVFFEKRNAIRLQLLREKVESIRERFCAKNEEGKYYLNDQKQIALLDEEHRDAYNTFIQEIGEMPCTIEL